MSIWSSIDGGRACRASDASDERTDEYTGTAEEELGLGVATALSWHRLIRLAIMPSERGELDRDLLLTEDSATVLRDMLDVALQRFAAARDA